MLSKTFLWIEDRKGKAGYIFWYCLMKQLCPGIVVESKKNNSELVKAVKNLKDTDNRYVIVFDNSFDNLQAAMEQKLLKQYADKRDNVILMDIICFEYILLEFRDLIRWIYAPNDKYIEEHNIEQLSAGLLFDLTRNTGFEVSKGNIGDCWIKSCCE